MPQGYVQALFDQYAPRFEKALVDDLGYRGPALLFKAVLAARGAAEEAGLIQARHRSRLRHRACGRRLRQQGRPFHRHRSVAAHDREARATGALCGTRSRRHGAGPARQARRQRRSHPRRGCHGLCRRTRAGAGRGQSACWPPAACSPSRSKPMPARASSSARDCATPTAPTMCAPAVEAAGLKLSLLEDLSARNEDNDPVPGLVVVAGERP